MFTSDGPRSERDPTRRSLLGSIAGLVGTAVVAGGTATGSATASGGQVDATTGILPEQPSIEGSLTGFWLHLGGELSPVEAGVADSCDAVDWTNDATLAYEARLVDRSADPAQTTVTLYLNERTAVSPGDLFIVNDREPCEGGYVGVELEQLGMDLDTLVARDASGTPAPSQTTGGSGPGPGVLGTLAGLAGGGWLLGRRRSGD